MIFVTGDTHSDVMSRLNMDSFPEQKNLTKNDYVIICGDFGLVWDQKESKREKHDLDWLDSRNFATLFVDGNHENFDRLNTYPVENWHGGKVHKIRPSVIHLMRGQVFEIDNRKIFSFGGARSHDIDGGIYEADDPKLKQLKKQEQNGEWVTAYRINHISWWQEEMPNRDEFAEGLKNLETHDFNVDYIISHDMPSSTLILYSSSYACFKPKPDELENYLEDVRIKTDYKHWFCGHYHDERRITEKESVLYYQIVKI